MEPDNITQSLAVWGAITGTIGTIAGIASLLLRFNQHHRDKPKLRCISEFKFEHSAGIVRPIHKITVRSIGRRPVVVDSVRYYLRPRSTIGNLLRGWHWRQTRWIYTQSLKTPIRLMEGEKGDISIDFPQGLTASEAVKAEVNDQSGKRWPVEWPRARKLRTVTETEQLHESEDKTDGRGWKVVGYSAGGQFHIYAHWNAKAGSSAQIKGRFFHLNSVSDYEKKLDDILSRQKSLLLKGEIDEIT